MRIKEQGNQQKKPQKKVPEDINCRICGGRIDPETCTWEEYDSPDFCCLYCRAELQSCGCSD